MPYLTKAVIVGSLTTVPMFFSGIILVRSLATAAKKDEALGANMIRALLQSVTFATGIKVLLLVMAGFYVLSSIFRPGPVRRRAFGLLSRTRQSGDPDSENVPSQKGGGSGQIGIDGNHAGQHRLEAGILTG